MNFLTPAQACAQFITLFVLVMVARWYLIPWLNSRARGEALIALLWVHVFRYVALQVFSAQQTGFPISDGGAMEIVVGDVRWKRVLPLAWSIPPWSPFSTAASTTTSPTW